MGTPVRRQPQDREGNKYSPPGSRVNTEVMRLTAASCSGIVNTPSCLMYWRA